MPRCSVLLSKIMSSLLSPSQRRTTLHRRPALPYRRWESELRQRVTGWYRTIGSSRDQPGRAEQLGLCHQFFQILGEVNPLTEKPFHLLPFYQRVWLLKGLCDHVYETQKDVQDTLLSQPIHECRESILGYDSKENAYIHFPHFCGADLRIYCQSPSTPPAFPFPSLWVRRVEKEPVSEDEESDGMKDERVKSEGSEYGGTAGEYGGFGNGQSKWQESFKEENGDEEAGIKRLNSWSPREESSESASSDGDSCEDLKLDLNTNFLSPRTRGGSGSKACMKEDLVKVKQRSQRLALQQEQGFTLGSVRTIKAETEEPCLSVGEHCYTGRSPARSANMALTNKPGELKVEGGSPTQGHQKSTCSDCAETGNLPLEDQNCCCGASRPAEQLSSESAENSSGERVNDKIWGKKKKRKKKRGREQLLRGKGEHRQLQRVDRMRLSTAETAKSAERRVVTTIKRKEKKMKLKAGKKADASKKIKEEPLAEPLFKLVCTNLDELRELISKIEDELDDLESTKKRLGRWYYRKEAVKDLHSTLIRLLNELSPWEPKLVKAYQRNRLRLKKEFDDFKNHPEYNNFVREESISSSSSSSDEDEEKGFGKEGFLLSDQHRRSDEDLEHAVPRGLWSGASTREYLAGCFGERTVTMGHQNHLKHPLDSPEKGISLLPRVQTNSSNIVSTPSGLPFKSEVASSNQSEDSNTAWTAKPTVQTSLAPSTPILHPTTGLPRGYTPIPTLLAKSVGNKVTLMKRPADCPMVNNVDKQIKESVASLSTSTVTTTKILKAQTSSPSFPQIQQQTQAQGAQQTEVGRHPGMAIVTAAPPKSSQAKTVQTVPKNPVQVIYKVPERLGHLVQKDGSSPVKIAVNTGENTMQQVVILPSNLLIKNTDEKASSVDQQQCKGNQVTVSKSAGSLCMSTNVPGFTIPENRIPVQQVAPLKDTKTVRTPSPSESPRLKQGSLNEEFNKAQVSCTQISTTQVMPPKSSTSTTPSSASPIEPSKPSVPKQELKTVCIRDSQSILVTTRGGNTGIVKVQTSLNKNAAGSLPCTPVITISPQFKAFLISKTSQTPLSAPSQTPSCTIPAVTNLSLGQPQMQAASLLQSTSSVMAPLVTAASDDLSSKILGGQSAGTIVSPIQGPGTSVGSTATAKISHQVQSTATSSNIQTSQVKNTVVSSLSSTVIPQRLPQSEFTGKTGVKRPNTDERSQVTKFILVTPSSSAASNEALPKGTVSTTKPIPASRVMFVSPPTVPSSTTSAGISQKQAIAAGPGGQLLTTSLSSNTPKIGLSPGKTVGGISSEGSANMKNIPLPSGAQIQLAGNLTTIGQTIGALSGSPSKSIPISACPTATTSGLVHVTDLNMVTSCASQLPSNTSLATTFKLHGIPSLSMIPQSSSSSSSSATAAATMPQRNIIKKTLGTHQNAVSSNSLAQVTTTVQSISTPTSSVIQLPPMLSSGIGESLTCSSEPAFKQNQATISSPNNLPITTTATATIQQKIVIKTSTPLAAGTQILLNNARFLVPPQGLGPGSHVLIISSPPPQQVPTVSATCTTLSVPPQGVNHVALAPRAPILPQSLTRQPSAPAVSSPFVACTPAVGPSLPSPTPNVFPVQLKSMGSPLLHSRTNVVAALPRLPTLQAGGFASPAGTPTLVSSTPRLVSVPAIVSPVVTSAPVLGSALATVRLATGIPVQAECSSTNAPTVAPTLPRLSTPLSSLSFLPNQSPAPMPSSVIKVPETLSSAAGTSALHLSVPTQKMVSVVTPGPGQQAQHTAVGIEAHSPAFTQALAQTGLVNTSFKKTEPAGMQPVLAGIRTQVLPTVAVPPIVSAVSRMQTLPVATVPPIGSTVRTFEAPPVVTASSSSSTVIMSPTQTISSLRTNSIHPPVVLTNEALVKHSLQTTSLGIRASVPSKLLISPDGAVLNTVQCQVNPAELTTCPKPLDSLVVSTNSSAGALHTHDSSLKPLPADRKCTN